MERKRIKFMAGIFLIFIPIWNTAAQSFKMDANVFGAIEARQIGPAVMSGRISALDAVDSNPGIVYIGAASGGLWKSRNFGTTFKPVFDKYCQSIGTICIDQVHPDTVWVGTGEVWVRNSVSVGDGIYKTTDAGETWQKMGLDKTERIAKIVVNPGNSNLVYVAALGHLWNANADRGVYKTNDGGKSWNRILFVDENTGCCDLVMDPVNPDILYAAMWEFRRTPYSFASGGKGSGLYKSTDGGQTWTKLTKDLPSGNLGRIALSVSPVNPELVFAVIESKKTSLFRSPNKGESWTELNKTMAVQERPFYFSLILADPVDSNIVYKPGMNLNVSYDGGKTFRNAAIEGGNVHSDLHAIYIGKSNNKLIYLGTDGGVYFSLDQGNTWKIFRNLPLSQFYHVKVDMQNPYNVYGGLQDNGSWYGPSRQVGGITNANWKSVGIGDGFNVSPDKADVNIIYWQYQGGNIFRYYKNTEEYKSIKPYPGKGMPKLRFNWNAPVVFSPVTNAMYIGAQFLFKSNNRGDSWNCISPDLTTNNPEKLKQEESGGLTIDNSTAENHCTIITINESPLDTSIIWAGTDDGNLQVTADGGKTWSNVVQNIQNLPSATWCSFVEPGHFDKNTVYATFDGHRTGDPTPYVFKSTDLGKTWTLIADSSIQGFCHVIREDLDDPNLLFVGSESGLYISIDGGNFWTRFTGNMPKVPVNDMVIHPRENDLVMATHGRGIMIIDDLTPFRQLTPELFQKDIAFIQTRDYIITEGSIGQGWSGDDEFIGRNPPEAALIAYYLKKRHIFGDMHVEIADKNGTVIKKLPAGQRKGINIVPWNIRLKPPKVPPSPQLEGNSLKGPTYGPGEYQVKLVMGNETYESTVTLKLDPNSPHSDQDREIRQKAVMHAYTLLEDLAVVDGQTKDMMDQLNKNAKAASKKLAKKLTDLATRLETIHKALVATKEGAITGEEQIREQIGEVYGNMMAYLGRPTDSQLEELQSLQALVDKYSAQVNTIFMEEIPALNSALTREKIGNLKILPKEELMKEK